MDASSAPRSGYDFSLGHPWGEFRDPDIELAFRRYAIPREQLTLQVLLAFAAGGFLLHFLDDIVALGWTGALAAPLAARMAFVAPALVMLWQLSRGRAQLTVIRRISLGATLLVLAVPVLVLLLVPASIATLSTEFMVILLAVYGFVPIRLPQATLAVLLASVAFFMAARRAGGAGGYLFSTGLDLITVNLFGHVLAQTTQRRARRDFAAMARQRDISIKDHLTGCYNRHYLHGVLLPEELARAQRKKRWLSFILCDVDRFKDINDTYGHAGGDEVLRRFAQILQGVTRHNRDSVVRYGGEEFLIVLPDTPIAIAADIAERLRLAFAHEGGVAVDGRVIMATASFGVSGVDFSDVIGPVSGEALLAAADRKLYLAKNSGRNTVRYDEPFRGEAGAA